MIYSLSFIPEVEKDALSGYWWYEGKATQVSIYFASLKPCENTNHAGL